MATTKIKCPVEGIVDLDRLPGVQPALVRAVIDARELQRLRYVKQLGFTELVYPGAVHTRFAHSLGSFQGAQHTLRQLRDGGADISDEWFVATAVACLLHDVGHGPFSHTYESVSNVRHEDRTLEMLKSGPELPAALDAIDSQLRGRVLGLLRGDVPEPGLAYLGELVSSALDCDRMDYLRRDALFTGARYGMFDRDWLIRDLAPSGDGSHLVLVEKGRSAVEQYLIGRYHMFQNVYLHKTSRGFETAFRGLCRRLRALGSEALPPHCPALSTLHVEDVPLAAFLDLTDGRILTELDGLLDHDDATVRALTRALRRRHPLRCVTARDPEALEALDEESERRRERAARAGLDPDCAVWRDEASDTPYRPYSPEEGRKGLRIRRRSGDLVDVTEVSPTLAALAQRIVVHRLYWLDVERA